MKEIESSEIQNASRDKDQDLKVSVEFRYANYIASQRRPDNGPLYASIGDNSGLLYMWIGTHWKLLEQAEGERMAWNWLEVHAPMSCTPKKAQSCHTAACIKSSKLEPSQRDGKFGFKYEKIVIVPVQNGYLHIDNFGDVRLKDPDPNLGITYCLRCEYKKQSMHSHFSAFVKEILPDEGVRDLVQEYCGYTLIPDTRFQNAQWWIGSGANGKGTLAKIIAALHEKTSAVALDDLDGFRLMPLLNSTLIYVDETPKSINEQRVKTLISGDLIFVDRKHRDPVSFRPTAKWIVLGNELPIITDQSEGFWRRWHVIEFVKQFKGKDRKPLLAEKIIEEEMSGVLNWVVEGLVRLLKRGHFPAIPESVENAIKKGKTETNSVFAWFIDCRIKALPENTEKKFWTIKELVYSDYKDWTKTNGYSPVSSGKFWNRLKNIENNIQEVRCIREEITYVNDRPKTRKRKRRLVNIVIGGLDAEETDNTLEPPQQNKTDIGISPEPDEDGYMPI